ncbi:AMP-binding protein [Lentzea sp. NBRC 102530]|uniref:AMP-binding protein n=1 Tax=Lentzea sp. NBRC 102530 TaxID=3032201 RepID=UPI002553AC67|nr:AMP-binding protein [Lentzea sp. NBRC 102530]
MTAEFLESALWELPAADRALVQAYGSGPSRTPPSDHVHHAFEAHAARRPHATAVEHLGESLTYAELDARAGLLAEVLVRGGVRPGDHVGLFLTRSISMVVGVLAVLKAGASYVPQDVSTTPEATLRRVVRAARIDVVLTTSADAVPGDLASVVEIDALPGASTFCRTVTTAESDVAAVVFTGPHGVRVSHAGLCNLLLTAPGSLGVTPGTRVAQLLDISSDLAMWEVLGTLANGGTLVLRGEDAEDAASTADVLITTPGVLASLSPDACRRVRTVVVAGERCPRALADTWARRTAFHHAWGPTEATIVSTVQRYEPDAGPLTVGRPVPNTTAYVLGDDLSPRPVGEVGEVWVGGAGVTPGYAGDLDLTSLRLRPDPFLGGDRLMFRTRELGRWTADGELEHHGRAGDQVEVLGYRFELDTVTAALEHADDCERAATLVHDGRLVGFISPRTAVPEVARRAVSQRLPHYCVPTLIVPLDALPTTERGKVDRRALLSCLDGRRSPALRA